MKAGYQAPDKNREPIYKNLFSVCLENRFLFFNLVRTKRHDPLTQSSFSSLPFQ